MNMKMATFFPDILGDNSYSGIFGPAGGTIFGTESEAYSRNIVTFIPIRDGAKFKCRCYYCSRELTVELTWFEVFCIANNINPSIVPLKVRRVLGASISQWGKTRRYHEIRSLNYCFYLRDTKCVCGCSIGYVDRYRAEGHGIKPVWCREVIEEGKMLGLVPIWCKYAKIESFLPKVYFQIFKSVSDFTYSMKSKCHREALYSKIRSLI